MIFEVRPDVIGDDLRNEVADDKGRYRRSSDYKSVSGADQLEIVTVAAEVRRREMRNPDSSSFRSGEVSGEGKRLIPRVKLPFAPSGSRPVVDKGHLHAPYCNVALLLAVERYRNVLHHAADHGDVGHFELAAHPAVVAGVAYESRRHLRVGNDRHDPVSPREIHRPEILPLVNPHRPNVFPAVDCIRTKDTDVRHGASIRRILFRE